MALEGRLVDAAVELAKAANKQADAALPPKIAGIVKTHAALGVASAFIPIPGVDMAAAAAVIWGMYIRINNELNMPFQENLVKSVASGVATNLAASVGVTAVASMLKLIPGLGTVPSIALMSVTTYALTLASGYVYLKALTMLLKQNPAKGISASDWDEAINRVMSDKHDIKSFMGEAKKSYTKSHTKV